VAWLAVGAGLAPQDREALGVPIIQDLHHLGLLVGEPEVCLVDDEGSPPCSSISSPKTSKKAGARKASRMRKMGETVEVPEAKMGL
jgi:hypothetical protein